MLIRCSSKSNMVVTTCDTCGQHKVIPDTVPVSITILTGDQKVENISALAPISVSVVVKNKEGKNIKGVTISFTAAPNSGSVSAASQKTDSSGTASATWTLNPQPDSAEVVLAKVIYNNIVLSVQFHASVVPNSYYNFSGTLTMDSTIGIGNSFVDPNPDPTNRPDPFTIPSDSLALSNGVAYPFELDSFQFPHLQQGEHGECGFYGIMRINHFLYGVTVCYEVGGLIIIDVTKTDTYTSPEIYTVTMKWELRGEGWPVGLNGQAYLLETVSSPTRGTFTNSRTGTFTTTGQISH
jgi:hypothetical protein